MSAGRAAVAAWRDFWFRERSLLDLAISRIALAGIALYLDEGGRFLRAAMISPEHWVPIPFVRWLGLDQPSLTQLYWLGQATRWTLVASGIGLFTNASLGLAFLLQLLQEGYLNSLGKVSHGTIPILYALLFFAMSPCGRRLSIDALVRRLAARFTTGRLPPAPVLSPHAGWPLELLLIELAAFYFQAGYAKLANGGLAWADGYSLQFYLLEKAQPEGAWLASHLWMCAVFSTAVLALELGFPLAIFARRLRPFFLIGGLAFHFGTIAFMNVVFWPVWALYVLFVPWSRLAPRRWRAASSATLLAPSR